jgi:hypothetical protein
VLRADFLQCVGRGAHSVAVRGFAELVLFAESDQKHALGLDAFDAAQQQRRAEPAREIALREHALQSAARRAIGELRCARQLARAVGALVDAEHETAGLHRVGRAASYAKFQCDLRTFRGAQVSHDLPPLAAA